MTELLSLLIGLLVGYYARALAERIKSIYLILAEKYDSHQAGVVRPQVSKVTKSQPINLESDTGGIMRPSPNQVLLNAAIEREKRIKNQ